MQKIIDTQCFNYLQVKLPYFFRYYEALCPPVLFVRESLSDMYPIRNDGGETKKIKRKWTGTDATSGAWKPVSLFHYLCLKVARLQISNCIKNWNKHMKSNLEFFCIQTKVRCDYRMAPKVTISWRHDQRFNVTNGL